MLFKNLTVGGISSQGKKKKLKSKYNQSILKPKYSRMHPSARISQIIEVCKHDNSELTQSKLNYEKPFQAN